MKIVVMAHCQAWALANCIRVLAPRHDIYHLGIYNAKTDEGKAKFIDFLNDINLILTIPMGPEWGVLATEELEVRLSGRVHRFPSITFNGYHPDITYIRMPNGSFLASPLGDYNSTIAVAAYLAGLSVEDAEERYNSLVYHRLGYFLEFQRAKQLLLPACQSIGYDLSAEFERWTRQGCFMHSVNHPRLIVSDWLARETLRLVGIPFDDTVDLQAVVPDDHMQGVIWPVYPEIAHRLGCGGSYIFKAQNRKNELWNYLTLERFVAESYRMYEGVPREILETPPSVRQALELFQNMA